MGDPGRTGRDGPRSPSMLDLVRLSTRRLFPPGGEDLYRQIALLAKLCPGLELLDVACGKGIPLEYFVREYQVQGSGVEEDGNLISHAEAHFKEVGLSAEASFQQAPHSDLPFRDATFDVVVGELGLAATSDPANAIQELVRVARPGGRVVLVQLVWQAPVNETRKRVLSEHLGARPLMAVELRRILMDAGVGDLHTEDWIDARTAFRSKARKPFPDFAELFGFGEKVGILRRARKQWGWKGVFSVFKREIEVHRLLTKERILGLNLLLGVKAGPSPTGNGKRGEALNGDFQASGLPLFGSEGSGEN